MLQNIIFSRNFCYFEDTSNKITADDDVTCMMMSSLIYCVYYYLQFLVIEILYNSQNFTAALFSLYHSTADENEYFFM